jgi:D-lactate dehydrogenase (quinone)
VQAVVRPGNLAEQWRVLKACAAANKIIIMQAANTGNTGGSTPDGSDYDRDIVIVSALRMARLRLISEGRQVICHPGVTSVRGKAGALQPPQEPRSLQLLQSRDRSNFQIRSLATACAKDVS